MEGVASDIELGELLDQIRERIAFADEAAGRARRRLTPRRVVRAIFRLVRARRDRGLAPYPASLVHAAVRLLISDDDR